MYTKLLAAAIVLCVGFALASLFPKGQRDVPGGPALQGGVTLRRADEGSTIATPGGPGEASRPIGATSSLGKQLASWPEALVSTRSEATVPLREPPPMPAEYAALAADDSARTTSSGRVSGPAAVPREPGPAQRKTIHQVVDGDTLARIAANYLGDAALAGRISEANGGNISDPLVVGSELQIPARSPRPQPHLTSARPGGAQTRLVPVTPAQVMADSQRP